MNLKKLFLVLGVAAMATFSMAQGFRGGGGFGTSPTMLLQRADVQTELALTDEEKTKLQDLRDSMMPKFREAFQNANGDRDAMTKAMQALGAESETETNKILTADQQKRLKQIGMWVFGYRILTSDKDLQTQVGLTDAEKAKIADLQKQEQDANASVFQKVQSGEIQREDIRGIMDKNNAALNDNIGKVLSDGEKAKFKDLSGKTFTETDPPPGGNR